MPVTPASTSETSGGVREGQQITVFLTRSPLSVEAISKQVSDHTCGSVITFAGTTRDNLEGKEVLQLEYETFEPVALKEMEQIAREALGHSAGVRHIACAHRLGVVPPTESSIVIAVASEIRSEGFDACRFVIDTVKARVPIARKEIYADGESCKAALVAAAQIAPAVTVSMAA
eukprot:gnl/TRDRNA2_/TRDRNA2_94332_c0_seq2.p1 gnl/TRDRNA2_/TRDRNA2_94332_c0~~gnl/TRDRNA2_/TRDRNA2_94332_c0_seq2.p1  ORF type:complete len:174 (-),score=33.17 gnl/TRDRNA2_/TRDRNA2_94332_c0_seq2:9-530(-)